MHHNKGIKYFLIILVIVIGAYMVWQAIQTKPKADVPKAAVEETQTTVSTTTTTTTTTPVPATETATTAPTEVASGTQVIDNARVSINFKGFGPGKVHEGSISNVDSKLSFDPKGKLQGSIVANLKTLTTGTDKLDAHLNSKDFFDTAKFPTATFKVELLKVASATENGTLTGEFTIKGITKKATLPVKNGTYKKTCTDVPAGASAFTTCQGKTLTSDFTLDMKDFGITNTFANSVIQLTIVVPLK